MRGQEQEVISIIRQETPVLTILEVSKVGFPLLIPKPQLSEDLQTLHKGQESGLSRSLHLE